MKKGKISTGILARLLCVMMVVSLMSTTVFAAAKFSQSQLSLVTDKQSELASGVTQNIYTVYDKNGKQVKMFAATIDPSVETVKLFTSYKDMDNTSYGMSKLTEQVAAFDKKAAAGDEYYHGTVVAGINASYYNMTTGKPSGVFVMNGNDVTGGDKSAYFAVLKDGTVKIGNADEYETDKGNIQEALGIYKMLVYDGNIVLSDSDKNSTQKYPRQTIGITEDNKVIILSADGNQEPESIGLTLMEQAQVMIDLGCKWAGHLDGGGSMTYGSKPEGEDTFRIVNKPSDGSERSISNGLIVVSTAVASKTFDHVSFDAEAEYATPDTPVEVKVSGVSSTGNAAEIPAGITYSVENGTYENGVLTAAGVGDVVLTANYNGKEAGSTTVHAVIPEKLDFNSSSMTVPFGKKVAMEMTATYGLNEVKFKASDIQFTLENDGIGTINGFDFTAGDGSVTSSKITASFKDAQNISAESTIKLGKGSDVVFDFEDGNTDDFTLEYPDFNYVYPEGKVYPVTAETGKVHSGNGAMALDINYGNSLESGYMMTALRYQGDEMEFRDATRLGMWIYISDEDVSAWIRYTVRPLTAINEDGTYQKGTSAITNTLMDDKTSGTGIVSTFEEPGWHYLSIDLSAYKGLYLHQGYIVQFYISDRDGAAYNYYYNRHKSYNGRYVMYVDDITVDYSDAVEDREAPVFGDVTYATASMSDAAVLNGQTVSENVLSFGVKVADNTKKSNYTGLDAATAKAYIDGVKTKCTIKDGVMSVSDVALADGVHHVKFSICDNQGNYASVIRTINVQANSGNATVKIVAHDPELDKILLGSVWYADIVATDIEKVKSVEVDIDLNNMSKWELDNMEVAPGFEADYSIQDDENIATITITRTGSNDKTGEGVLASLPIRTWELKMGYTYTSGTKNGKPAYTYAQFKNMKEFWPIDISMDIDRGIVKFTDGTTDTFSGEGPQVDTEMYKMAKDMISTTEGKAYYDAWNGGHTHTAKALEDKAATCTETGYTGRTFCDVCNSVVEWGTTIPATGHSYDFVDGVLKCTICDELFNGTYIDGKTYVDGVVAVAENGWKEDSYYKDGKKLTGIQKVNAPGESDEFYYDFGEDGVCAGQMKYTGLVQIDDKWYYSKIGTLTGGWAQIDNNWHYFRSYTKSAVTGEYTVNGITYQFDEKGMTKGTWHKDDNGTRYYYGPGYYLARNPGYLALYEIDGKTYNFGNDGYITIGEIQVLQDAASLRKVVYKFNDDGSVIERITTNGIITDSKGDMYYIGENGEISLEKLGLIEFDGAIYYVKPSGKIAVNESKYISAELANGLIEVSAKYVTRYFGADGKMEQPFTGVRAGADGILYYYVNDVVMTGNPGLVEFDGAIYYVKPSGKIAVNENRYISAELANELIEVGTGYITRYFGADGKLEQPFTGVKAGADGILYYYVNDVVKTGNPGLIEIEGAIYYVKPSGKIAVNESKYISAELANGLIEVSAKYVTRYFGVDGKLEQPFTGVKAGADSILYYYVNDIVMTGNPGLVEFDGAIYYVKPSGKIAVNENRYISAELANELIEVGTGYITRYFGADGKLEQPFTGVKAGADGILYYYVNDVVMTGKPGLVKFDDAIYYVKPSGKIAVDENRYISAELANGLIEVNAKYVICYFGEDGKMVTKD